jgi:hypothetical protein
LATLLGLFVACPRPRSESIIKPAALLACLALTGCQTYSWHQKMTVTVQTPSGEVSGSAVTAVRWSKHWIQSDGMGWDYALAGEAVVVEVTPGHYLFALLRSAATTEYMGSVAAAAISGQEGRVIDTSLFAQVEARQGEASRVIEIWVTRKASNWCDHPACPQLLAPASA